MVRRVQPRLQLGLGFGLGLGLGLELAASANTAPVATNSCVRVATRVIFTRRQEQDPFDEGGRNDAEVEDVPDLGEKNPLEGIELQQELYGEDDHETETHPLPPIAGSMAVCLQPCHIPRGAECKYGRWPW